MGTLSTVSSRLCLSGLALLTVIAYARVWWFGFVYDDPFWIEAAPGPWALAAWIGGGLPWAFHGLALTLHLVNGGLLWVIARRWLSPLAALVVLTVFWLHPLQVEAVAYVSGSWEVLLATYLLIAIWGFLRGQWWSVAFGAGALGLALSLKWSALALLMTVPVVGWSAVPRRVRVVGLSTMAIVGGAVIGRGWPTIATWIHAGDQGESVRAVALAIWRYLAFVIWPTGFSIEHDWTAVPVALGWLALAGLLALGVVAWRSRVTWCAWVLVAGGLLPRAAALHMPPLTEHHMYVPFLAVWVVAGAAFDSYHERLTHG